MLISHTTGGLTMGINKGQYELAKERKQQEIQAIDLKIYDNKIAAKRHNLEESKIKVDIAKESVTSAKIGLQQSQTNNSIASEKLTQSKDTLSFEKNMSKLNRQNLINQAKQAVLSASQAQAELQESQELFKLKYGKTPSQTVNISNSLGGL